MLNTVIEDFKESYNKWSPAIEISIKTVQRITLKNARKDIKELQKNCKRFRKEYSITVEFHEKIIILENKNIERTYYRKI